LTPPTVREPKVRSPQEPAGGASYSMDMIVYFVRHGAAVDGADWGGSDGERPLTRKGIDKMERVGERLEELEIEADAIVTSPLLRAKQTAEVLAEALDLEEALSEDERLGGDFDRRGLAGILNDRADAKALVLVGHEPSMSSVIGELVGGARIDFKKGAVACVDVSDTSALRGVLLWMASPKILTN
jgi:phosphohistidine phosphatase